MIKKNRFSEILAVLVAITFFISAGACPLEGQTDIAATVEKPAVPLPQAGNITVNFKDVDILTVLNYLSDVGGVDIIPSPGVTGNITMRLRDKPWEVALDIVTRNYGFAYSRDGNIIRVMPRSMLQTEDVVTAVIPLKHIIRDISLVKQGGLTTAKAKEEVTVEKEQEGINRIMDAINATLDEKKGEKATYVTTVNAIIVTAIPAKINSIKQMLGAIDKKPAQILLDAKVVEILLDDDERMGIDWNVIVSAAGARRPTTLPFTADGVLKFLPNDQRAYLSQNTLTPGVATAGDLTQMFPPISLATLPTMTQTTAANALNVFSYGTLDFSQFTAVLNMISDRTDTNIISTPRITTLNNQKATIKVVQRWMLQKSVETTQTAAVVTVEFETDDEAREIGVKLAVIPHVNDEGDILVNLIPEVSSDPSFSSAAITATLSAVAMTYNTREANTQIRVQDGETIFIGGLIKDSVIKRVDKVPILGDFLGDVPYIGKAFKFESEQSEKTEVVFFVTVHLVSDGADSIKDSHTVYESNKYEKDYYAQKDARDQVKLAKDKEKSQKTLEALEKEKKAITGKELPAQGSVEAASVTSEKTVMVNTGKDAAVTEEKKKAWLDFSKK